MDRCYWSKFASASLASWNANSRISAYFIYLDRLVSLGDTESEVEHFDNQILGVGDGEMIDDPIEVTSHDFVLNADIRVLCLPSLAELITTTDCQLCRAEK